MTIATTSEITRETLNPRQPICDEEARQLLQTQDGAKWANAFCRATGFPDEGWALSWFCNAIMAGVDETQRKADCAAKIKDDIAYELGKERDAAQTEAGDLREALIQLTAGPAFVEEMGSE